MRTYRDKEELKNEICQSFEKYISEFDTIPEALKDKRVPGVDRTPAENLAYQVGWTTLLLKWEADEKRGMDVETPSEQFKWNQLGGLFQWFTDTYAHLSLAELKGKLNENIVAIQAMIDSMSEEELFQPHMRRWQMTPPKQRCGRFTNSFTSIPPRPSERFGRRSGNGKRLCCKLQGSAAKSAAADVLCGCAFIHSQGFSLTQHHIAV